MNEFKVSSVKSCEDHTLQTLLQSAVQINDFHVSTSNNNYYIYIDNPQCDINYPLLIDR